MDVEKEALLTKNNAPTVQGYPLIRLGYGKVEVGTGECEGEPVILFTNHGTGVIGENTVDEPRVNDPKDVYAAISITNIDSLNVVREQLDIFASKYLNEVAPTVQDDLYRAIHEKIAVENTELRAKVASADVLVGALREAKLALLSGVLIYDSVRIIEKSIAKYNKLIGDKHD